MQTPPTEAEKYTKELEEKCKERMTEWRNAKRELEAVAEEKRLGMIMWLAHEVIPTLEEMEPEEQDSPCLPNRDALDQILEVPVDELCKLAAALLLQYQIPALGGNPTEKALAEAYEWVCKVHDTISLLVTVQFGMFLPHPSLLDGMVVWKLYRYLYFFFVVGTQMSYN